MQSMTSDITNINELKWDRNYLIGHERIDREHTLFFNLIKQIVDQFEKGVDDSVIMRTLVELRKYADFHFYSEESIMLELEYKHYTDQKRMHDDLLFDLDRHIVCYEKGEGEPVFLIGYLYHWFFSHTIVEDKKIQEWAVLRSTRSAS